MMHVLPRWWSRPTQITTSRSPSPMTTTAAPPQSAANHCSRPLLGVMSGISLLFLFVCTYIYIYCRTSH
ncbi:uncharacterized protein BDR25DRAFT_58384 [Lindgomyces ingoldianus]|uniref:Uncharacterized protein n=1 Tax=Lindgomyces ingoldianus TaxID=673940 RepID=A0ACB6QMP5_9PLEO|nr:uncharacterized protein BDR25DRAFT_58384 [Lindgomyces ingoldianus]KAF2468181.1 hypothetical protein BDR25DRAFT_58384 [Lindgomyces ingoldianus]